MFHNYETEKITRKAGDAAEYIELFCSSVRDRHAGCIQCYSLNVRRYMCRHAWQSRVDDLGWKNRTTCYNCRFSAMSLALRVVFSGRTTLYKTLKSDRTSEIEHRRVMGCKKKYIEMFSSFIEPFSWFIFPCCSSLQLAKVLIVIISQVLFIAESANNIHTIYCNGHEYNQLGYTQDGPINSEKGLNALYVGSFCISWVIRRTVT